MDHIPRGRNPLNPLGHGGHAHVAAPATTTTTTDLPPLPPPFQKTTANSGGGGDSFLTTHQTLLFSVHLIVLLAIVALLFRVYFLRAYRAAFSFAQRIFTSSSSVQQQQPHGIKYE